MMNNRRTGSMVNRASRRTPIFTFCTFLATIGLHSQLFAGPEIPGLRDGNPIVIRAVTIHTVSGNPIENGALTIVDGKIASVGENAQIETPDKATVIQFQDGLPHHLYPGLIDADTVLGLVEIDAVRATRDMSETGELNPNAKALIAFNPDSELIPVARTDGVMIALVAPNGDLLRGQSALMMLDGWTGQDMVLVPTVGMHLSWPKPIQGRSWKDDEEIEKRLKTRHQQLQKITELFAQASVYRAARKFDDTTTKYDPRLESMIAVVAKEMPLFVHANDIRQMEEAIAFSIQNQLKLIIVGGYDAQQCHQLLKQHDIPVIVTGTHRLPRYRHSPYDEPFTLPARLKAAGVKFCLAGYNRFSASAVRNLPQQAGTAAAFGLGTPSAVRAITLSAAEILGIANRVGSIETGKDATLIITDGEVLDLPSNLSHAFIQGRPVDLDNRHKRLYRKYKIKYERLEKSN